MGTLEGFKLPEKWEVPADMETSTAFSSRAIHWWNKVSQRQISLHAGELRRGGEPVTRNILVTTHGGLIVTLSQSLLGSRKIRCAGGVKVGKCLNASISVIELEDDGKGVLVKYSDVAHLEERGGLVEVNVDVIGLTAM